jgi:hypothetical protein
VTATEPPTAPIRRASHRRPHPWHWYITRAAIGAGITGGAVTVFSLWVAIQALMGAAQILGWTQ